MQMVEVASVYKYETLWPCIDTRPCCCPQHFLTLKCINIMQMYPYGMYLGLHAYG